MNIQKFSKRTGIPAHTIRYYEKIGIFRNVNRNNSGHRFFTDNDIAWAEFIKRLKDTGMPLDKIHEYADLREKGEHTSGRRMALLINHANFLEEKIALEKGNLKKLKEKIKYYENLMNE